MESETKFYGIVAGHKNISFVLDEFQCVFINANLEIQKPEIIKHNQGFILVQTTDGKYIYIYSGKDIKIIKQITFNTWLYFVSRKSNIEKYKTVSFAGGILNKLFYKSALEFDYDKPTETKVKYQNDQLKYFLSNEKIKGNLSIRSSISERKSVENGNSIETAGTELEISFEEEKEIQSFSDIYGYILNLCQFMAFRRNVRFEKIALKNQSMRFPEIDEEVAVCFVYYDEINTTQKSIFSCITFNSLGECIDDLLNSIVNNKPNKPQFNISFIPQNDKEVNTITSMKIREVCSALESEMELAKIKVKQEEKFNDLITQLKTIVKNHRDGENPLTDAKVYEYILGTLNHLTRALSDRIEECFIQNQSIIGEFISRKQIDDIVRYRNTITHGNFMQLNAELADTTYVLMKLIYCCVLKRIGMEDDMIKELFKNRLIS